MKRILFCLLVLCLPAVADAGPIKRVLSRGKSVVGGVIRGGSCSGGACR